MAQVGSVLASRYLLERVLGAGASATTWRARDQVSGRPVAVKLLRSTGWSEALRQEFARLRGLHHPRLVQVHDLGLEDGVPFVVVELVDGPTLEVFARRARPEAALAAYADSLEALSFLHGLGIRHGDFKSENVLVASSGRGVLIDLGCARPFASEPDGRLSGTPAFMAPELLRGEAGDRRSDVYSVGVALRGLFSGRAPLSEDLCQLVERATAVEASERPGLHEFLRALGRPSGVAHPPRGRSPRIVGRELELRRFERELEALLEGRPGVRALALVGRDGVGRSRLLREMKWAAQLRCRVVEGEASQPEAVIAMLGRALGSPERRGLDALMSCQERLSTGPPVLAVFDDIQRGSDSTREAMAALLRLLDPAGALMLLVSSTVEVPGAETLEVAPLGVSAVSEWARATGLLSERMGAALHGATGGFPADVEQLLDELANGELAESELGSRGRSGPLTSAPELPSSAHEVAAVMLALGGRVSLPRLERLELDRGPLLALQSRGIVRYEGDSFELARPADLPLLTRALGNEALTRAHTRLAEDFDRSPPQETPREHSLRSSRRVLHWVRAGHSAEAAELLLAERSGHELAPEGWRRAAEAFDSGAMLRDPELTLAVAGIFATRGALEQALSLLARLLRRRPPAPWGARCRLEVGAVLLRRGDARRAARYLERALPELDSGRAPRALDQLARACVQLGDYVEAERCAQRGLAQTPASAELTGALHEILGVAVMYLGRVEEARSCFDVATRALPAQATPRTRVRLLSYRGIAEFRVGELDAAVTHYRAALEIAERHSLADQLSTARLNLATALQQRGDWGGALRLYQRALRLATALGQPGTQLVVGHNLGNLWLMIGLFERAEARLSEVVEEARRLGRAYLEGAARGLLGECALLRGDTTRARSLYARARASFEEQGARREEAEMCLGLYAVASADDDAEERSRWAEAAREKIASVSADDLSTRWTLQRARDLIREGWQLEAIESLERALTRARGGGERLLLAELEATLTQAAAAAGAEELAAMHGQLTRALLDRISVSLPPELRDAFWAHPSRAPWVVRGEPARRGSVRLPIERLLEINKRLNSSLATAQVLEHAIDAAVELSSAERGFILLRSEPDAAKLDVSVARNLDRERVGRSHLKFSRSIAEQVTRSGDPLLTTDARADERFRDHASVHAMRLTSVLCVPIASPHGVLGAIYLDNRFERGRFSEADLRTLVACADQVAIALTNARLHAALARRTQALEREQDRVRELLAEREAEVTRLEAQTRAQHRIVGTRYAYDDIIGRGPAMRELLATLDRVIDSPLSVLVQGESGTGKELVARAIHFSGARRDRPFEAVNCAALPDALLEGELFGWVKGAFTGADRDREGLFARGRGGTVFLDEIGETSPAMQAKLLRALQEGEVRPLGSAETLELDIRVVAATNRSLRDEVAAGRFREDLYYRLAVVELSVPPLRERREDITPIAAELLRRVAQDVGVDVPELHPDAIRALRTYPWPGNVRELENVLSRALVLCDGVVRLEDLGLPERGRLPRSREQFQQSEADRILRELHATDWNVSEVGRRLGIPRNTLYRKLARHGLERPRT